MPDDAPGRSLGTHDEPDDPIELRPSAGGATRATRVVASTNTPGRQELEATPEGAMEKRPVTAPAQPALFGAYRVDQEVGKLVLGQPHRMDVLASRAPDDRRAWEHARRCTPC